MDNQPHLDRAEWRKSGRSGGGENCVEVAGLDAAIAVRDSKDPYGPALILYSGRWRAFTKTLKSGRYDL